MALLAFERKANRESRSDDFLGLGKRRTDEIEEFEAKQNASVVDLAPDPHFQQVQKACDTDKETEENSKEAALTLDPQQVQEARGTGKHEGESAASDPALPPPKLQ